MPVATSALKAKTGMTAMPAVWNNENLVDAIVVTGDKTVTNYLHATTKIPVDFTAAPALTAHLKTTEQ